MREDSQKDTISGQKDKMTFEMKADKNANELHVRITRGFGVIVLDESEARWLMRGLMDCLPPSRGRQTKPAEGDK